MKNIILVIFTIFSIGCNSSDDSKVVVTTNSGNKNIIKIPEINSTVETNVTENAQNGNISTEINVGNQIKNDEVMMKIGKTYKVQKGDYIQEIDNARIKAIRNSEKDFTEVTLLSGKAKLIRGQN